MPAALEFENCYWCQDKQVAAICTDTLGASRCDRTKPTGQSAPALVVIRVMDLCTGEIFYLKELAGDCTKDEFFFCGPTLIITGGTGSPINPQAIK